MILVFEMMWLGTAHAPGNSSTIQVIARGFPEQQVRVYAHSSHLRELQSDPAMPEQANVSFQAIPVSRHFPNRPQIVSVRRGLREFWTLLSALRRVPAQEPCLIMLISATSTAVFAASFLARLLRRRIGVQVGLHGNLNDAFGWRSRNPLARAMDPHAALSSRHGGRVRFLVLENAIRRALIAKMPAAAETTDVLPLPINKAEADAAQPQVLTTPIRIGLVGQATESKGITPFLALAWDFAQSHPNAVSFHLVGNVPSNTDLSAFAVLNEPVPTGHLPRAEFVEKLRRLHYVCLPLQPNYYELSASGALIDAVVWMRPVIATRVPIIEDLFDRFGDIGDLCDDLAGVRAAIARLASAPDPQRYDRQVANLRQARTSRLPTSQASDYRRIVEAGFPGLLADRRFTPMAVPFHG
jgi:hypothetical protein